MGKNNRSISDDFGSRLKHLREQKGYTLKEMQEITGVSTAYICRMESGQRKAPSIPIIQLLADALDVKLTEILDDSKNKFDEETDIATLLLTSNFFVRKGELAEKTVKELLVEIIDEIISISFKSQTRFQDVIEIFQLIHKFRKELLKKEEHYELQQ